MEDVATDKAGDDLYHLNPKRSNFLLQEGQLDHDVQLSGKWETCETQCFGVLA